MRNLFDQVDGHAMTHVAQTDETHIGLNWRSGCKEKLRSVPLSITVSQFKTQKNSQVNVRIEPGWTQLRKTKSLEANMFRWFELQNQWRSSESLSKTCGPEGGQTCFNDFLPTFHIYFLAPIGSSLPPPQNRCLKLVVEFRREPIGVLPVECPLKND